jgi:hypothetical protein
MSRDDTGSSAVFNFTVDKVLLTNNVTSSINNSVGVFFDINPHPPDVTLLYFSSNGNLFGTFDVLTKNETIIGTTSQFMVDLAICPNGIMYGADNFGDLYTINLINAQTTFVVALSSTVVTLTCSTTNVLYASASGFVFSIDTSTGLFVNLTALPGNPPAAGDLVFFGADLYFATGSNFLYFIDLQNIQNSHYINIFGNGLSSEYGLAQLYYNNTVHLWGGWASNFNEIDYYSGAQNNNPVSNPSIYITGMTSFCWVNVPSIITTAGNINLQQNDLRDVHGIFVDNIFATPQFNMNSSERVVSINVHNDLFMNYATKLYFTDPALNIYAKTTTSMGSDADFTANRLYMTSIVPPTVTPGTGAGTSPGVSVIGNDCRVKIGLTNSGSSPAASATIFTVTFTSALPAIPYGIVFSAANPAAAALQGNASPMMGTESTASFTFVSGSTPLAATTTYLWHFSIC